MGYLMEVVPENVENDFDSDSEQVGPGEVAGFGTCVELLFTLITFHVQYKNEG